MTIDELEAEIGRVSPYEREFQRRILGDPTKGFVVSREPQFPLAYAHRASLFSTCANWRSMALAFHLADSLGNVGALARKPCAVASSFAYPSRRNAAFRLFSEVGRGRISSDRQHLLTPLNAVLEAP